MTYSIPPQTRIGHVHLKVFDIERSLQFYRDILGFEITKRYDPSAVFSGAGNIFSMKKEAMARFRYL